MPNRMVWACILLAMAIAASGCGDDSTGGASGSGGTPAGLAGDQKVAAEQAMAEINKHWVKAADGWITHKAEGGPFAPIPFLQQVKEIGVEGVETFNLSETDKLNGFEWAGHVSFKSSPVREAGSMGYVLQGATGMMVDRPKGRWSQWIDYSAGPMRVQKVKGQWRVNTEHFLTDGKIPEPPDYTAAGIAKP